MAGSFTCFDDSENSLSYRLFEIDPYREKSVEDLS
jgi:hypothetical protein